MAVSQKARTIAMPVAMVVGGIFHDFFDSLGWMTTYLIFLMLFVTFCRICVKDMKITGLHWIMLAFQIFGGVAVYLLLRWIDPVIAQGLMICIFASVAMAAVVIGGMLGANIATIATYTLISNFGVALAAPIFFSVIGANGGASFINSALLILARVGPLLILPFVAAWLLDKLWPKARNIIGRQGNISFWLWAVSLTIVMGRTVKFILAQPRDNFITEIWLAVGALAVCILQFTLGRYLGRKYGDTVAGGQSLGQKNTVLAIWMSQTYLDPLSSVAPAAYVVWQNIVNSWQLWRYKGDSK